MIDTVRAKGVSTHFMPWDSNGSMDQVMAWIKDGSIVTLREIHNWTNRPVWPQYPTLPTDTPPVPAGFDWNLWLGPEAERAYHLKPTGTESRAAPEPLMCASLRTPKSGSGRGEP